MFPVIAVAGRNENTSCAAACKKGAPCRGTAARMDNIYFFFSDNLGYTRNHGAYIPERFFVYRQLIMQGTSGG